MRPSQWIPLVGVFCLVVAGLIAWRFTPLSEWATPENVADGLRALSSSPWAPLSIGGAYIAACLAFVPITVMNAAIILALGAGWGVAYGLYGSVLGAVVLFGIGRVLGRKPLEQLDIKALNKPLALVRQSGLPGLILLRNLPVAPYSVANLVLGASGIRLWVYTLGTALGILPSLVFIAAVGFQLRAALENPTPTSWAVLGVVIAAVLLLAWWLKRRLAAYKQTIEQGAND